MQQLLAVIAVLLGAFSLTGAPPVKGVEVVGFALAVLWLEASSSRLPGKGYASQAPAYSLAAALTLGAAPAVLVMAGGWLLRGVVKKSFVGLLLDALPCLTVVTMVHLLQGQSPLMTGLAAAAVWAVLWTLVPSLLSQDLDPESARAFALARNAIWAAQTSLGLAAVAISLLSGIQMGLELLALLPLLALQSLVRRAIENPAASDYRRTHYQLQEALAQKETLSTHLSETEQERQAAATALRLVRAVTEEVAKQQTPDGLWEALEQEVRKLLPLRSIALFLPNEKGLEARYVNSPDHKRVFSAPLLALTEPAVERCWATGTPLFAKKSPPGPRLFEGDGVCAALGMGPGVLYLGKTKDEPFLSSQKALLELLTGHTGHLLGASLRREQERQALTQSQAALGELKSWNERLEALLNGARLLAGTLDPKALMNTLEDMMMGLFSDHAGCFFRLNDDGLLYTHGWPTIDRSSAQATAQHILESGRPLNYERLEGSPFKPFSENQVSLLGVVAESQHGPAGVLMVGGARPFSREDQDFLQLVGLVLAVTYRGAETHWLLKTSQEQLLRASKLAAVGQLAAGVAHELNTPLGTVMLAIEGAVRMLKKNPERVAQKLERAQQAVEHAQKITNDLLVFSENESGAYQPLDLAEMVGQSVDGFRGSSQFEKVRFETRLETTGQILGSAVELGQLLLQLVRNAADAMQDHQLAEVSVITGRDQQQVYLLVEDNGGGIPPDVEARMFEPFFTTKPVGHGTGLGLTTCREIALRHQGQLEYESTATGSRFRLSLPAVQA